MFSCARESSYLDSYIYAILPLPVAVVFAVPRVDDNDPAVRDLSVLLLPGQDVVHRQRGVISLLGNLVS